MATTYTHIAQNKWRTDVVIAIFIMFVIGLGYIFSRALGMFWILPAAIIFAFFQAFSSYWWSDKVALAISGARQVQKKDAPELYNLVENLSISAGLPTPRVYVIEDMSPNAFATGRDPKHAAIAVTSGLLAKLSKPELEGVISHEFSHVGNYDIRLSAVIVVLVGFVVLISDWFLHFSFMGLGDDDNSGSGEFGFIMMFIGFVLAVLSPLFAVLIQLAISRKREFLADAEGALLTRNPEGLASALEKISLDKAVFRRANKSTAHLFIANPLKDANGKSKGLFSSLFDTHPDPMERIKRLREMAM
jgi:heat shock protein HtpX